KWQVQTANMEVTWLLAFIVLFNSAVNADYPCICNYNVEKEVLGEVSQTGSLIGYLYEFDCKPEGPDTGNAGWLSIQFENQYGYLHKDSQTEKQTCPGNPSAGDIVTTTTPKSSTTSISISTTQLLTTTTPMPPSPSTTLKTTTSTPSNKNTIDDNFYHNKNNTVVTENCDINGHKCNSNTNVVSLRSNHHHAVGSFVSSTLFTVNGHCYEAVTAIHSWRVAESYCVNNGGHLAYISSKGQQDAIYQVVKEHIGQNVWIGLNDLDNEGSYRWISGNNYNYTNWKPGALVGEHANEDCVSMVVGTYGGTWQDTSYSVAVSTLAPTTTTTTSPVTTILATTASATVTYGCTTVYPHYGYTEAGTLFTINNTCYELNANLHTWRTANSMCNSKGGSLAYIDNRLVQDAMYNVLKSNFNKNVWIGLNDLQYEGYFSWVSGEKLSYTLWHNGYVGNNDGEDCVVMMASTPEGGHSKYQTTSTTRPTTAITDIPIGSMFSDGNTRLCPSSVRSFANQYGTVLAQYGHSCYELLNTEVTWTYAETLCNNVGGHLVQISGQQEETYIQQFLLRHGSPDVWIGLNDKQTEGHMHWTSGEPVNYLHWVRGHVDNIVGRYDEDCVVMFSQRGGHWDDVPCGWPNGMAVKHVGICEYS
ncbi:MRC1-like protein, partial [Mya arenaria]